MCGLLQWVSQIRPQELVPSSRLLWQWVLRRVGIWPQLRWLSPCWLYWPHAVLWPCLSRPKDMTLRCVLQKHPFHLLISRATIIVFWSLDPKAIQSHRYAITGEHNCILMRSFNMRLLRMLAMHCNLTCRSTNALCHRVHRNPKRALASFLTGACLQEETKPIKPVSSGPDGLDFGRISSEGEYSHQDSPVCYCPKARI